MIYIDKNIHKQDFDIYTKEYLKSAQNDMEGGFIPQLGDTASYGGFSKRDYKYTSIPEKSNFKGWSDILLQEQNGMCCYCMRKLDISEVSVEHLVPESFEGLDETEEYNFYASLAPQIRKNVITGSRFDNISNRIKIDVDKLSRMPHLIAHSNLFSACCPKGFGCSCNNHRGNHRVLPMMIMNNTNEWLKYDENGEFKLIYPDTEIAKNTISHLDINSSGLKEIRELWYLFSRKKIYLEHDSDIEFKDRDDFIRKALNLDSTTVLPSKYHKYLRSDSDFYWKQFLKFNWFYQYYLDNYPIN